VRKCKRNSLARNGEQAEHGAEREVEEEPAGAEVVRHPQTLLTLARGAGYVAFVGLHEPFLDDRLHPRLREGNGGLRQSRVPGDREKVTHLARDTK
jgi:hypothetical protein